MNMIPTSRPNSPTSLPDRESPRSAAWHEAWEHVDALERLVEDASIRANREVLMECVLRMRHALVRGEAGR